LPLRVQFNSDSYDLDDDALKYVWDFRDGGGTSTEKNPVHSFARGGKYDVILTAIDPNGEKNSDTVRVVAGNSTPSVSIATPDNETFFFEDKAFRYATTVSDKEEKTDNRRIVFNVNYIPKFEPDQSSSGHSLATFNAGKSMMESSDCKACGPPAS